MLAADGAVLYEREAVKLGGYAYCSQMVERAGQGWRQRQEPCLQPDPRQRHRTTDHPIAAVVLHADRPVRETINTYVYDRNFGGAPVCALNTSLSDEKIASVGHEISIEWSKVRSRPNLTNCFDSERKDGCSSF